MVQVDDAGQVEDSRIMMKGGDTRYTNVNVTPTKFAVVEFEFSIYPVRFLSLLAIHPYHRPFPFFFFFFLSLIIRILLKLLKILVTRF